MIRFLLLPLLSLVMISCAPRGESKSLSEVVSIAKTRYRKVKDVSLSPEIRASLDPVAISLADLIENPASGKVSKNSEIIADGLSELIPRASYTNRPALTSLQSQYLNVGNRSNETPAAIKLLAARTYSVLASELETRKFSL